MEIEIKKFFHFFWRERTPWDKSGLSVYWLWKFIAPIPTMGKM